MEYNALLLQAFPIGIYKLVAGISAKAIIYMWIRLLAFSVLPIQASLIS